VKIKGTVSRWLFSCFGLILLILIIIGLILSVAVRAFFYNEIPQTVIRWTANSAGKTALFFTIIIFTTEFLIALLVGVFNFYFIKSIINPVKRLSEIASQIARGNFNIKIEKRFDDEIGDLCDAVNHMSEELRASEKMKNDFVASVSHELRTPLTAIKGWAETVQMSDDPQSEVNKKGMTVIAQEAERLCSMVEGLLDFSGIQNNCITMMMDKIYLLAELGEAVYVLRNRANDQKKHLLYAEPNVLPPVMGDKNRLRQVFINIIDNALKYTSEDGIINIFAEQKDDFIQVRINDNGCGIPAIHLPNVKDKFYKANQTQIGSGIGLAVADDIVKMHGGTLDVVSEEGAGTTVTISIPILDLDLAEI
jgi:signal transduction histidine kinase